MMNNSPAKFRQSLFAASALAIGRDDAGENGLNRFAYTIEITLR